jgi:hypothetical protein
MKFNGWVRIDRSILELTMQGKLSNTEALVLLSLRMLADHATGMGKINGPVLRIYLPGLTPNTAKRTLQSLETKRYIFRQIIPQSRLIYPYWVNGYDIYDSSGKVRMLDLTQVFDSKDIRNLKYVSPEAAPEVAPENYPLKALKPKAVNHSRQSTHQPETAPETVHHSHHYNNKQQEQVTITKNNTNSNYPDSSNDASHDAKKSPGTSPELSPESVNTELPQKHGEGRKEAPSNLNRVDASQMQDVMQALKPDPPVPTDALTTIRKLELPPRGCDLCLLGGSYYESGGRVLVSDSEGIRRIAASKADANAADLVWREDIYEYADLTTGRTVYWAVAEKRLTTYRANAKAGFKWSRYYEEYLDITTKRRVSRTIAEDRLAASKAANQETVCQ